MIRKMHKPPLSPFLKGNESGVLLQEMYTIIVDASLAIGRYIGTATIYVSYTKSDRSWTEAIKQSGDRDFRIYRFLRSRAFTIIP